MACCYSSVSTVIQILQVIEIGLLFTRQKEDFKVICTKSQTQLVLISIPFCSHFSMDIYFVLHTIILFSVNF